MCAAGPGAVVSLQGRLHISAETGMELAVSTDCLAVPQLALLGLSDLGQCCQGLAKQSIAGGSHPALIWEHPMQLKSFPQYALRMQTCQQTASVTASLLMDSPASSGGQGRAGKGTTGHREQALLHAQYTPSFFWLGCCSPRVIPKDPSSPELQDRSLFSQNMAKMGP